MDLDGEVERLNNHLVGALHRAMRMCNEFAIPFDGTPGCVALAGAAAQHSDVPVLLVRVGARTDPLHAEARRLARHLGLALVERRTENEPTPAVAPAPWPSAMAQAIGEASLHARRIVVPWGSEELFRVPAEPLTSLVREAKIVQDAVAPRVQLRLPYLDLRLADYAARLPEGRRAPVIRSLAARFAPP